MTQNENGSSPVRNIISRQRTAEDAYPQGDITKTQEPARRAPDPAPRGRPKVGKRSNDAYKQISVYVEADVHKDIKILLLERDFGGDVSDLANFLLKQWRDKQKQFDQK
jgi:hypothetical protein